VLSVSHEFVFRFLLTVSQKISSFCWQGSAYPTVNCNRSRSENSEASLTTVNLPFWQKHITASALVNRVSGDTELSGEEKM
jgi:hypothetical protein